MLTNTDLDKFVNIWEKWDMKNSSIFDFSLWKKEAYTSVALIFFLQCRSVGAQT